MTITLEHIINLDRAMDGVRDASTFNAAADRLRRETRDVVIMHCDASDVLEEPYRCCATFDIHLIDCSSHCPTVTGDPHKAGGLLLAWRGAA